MLSALVRLNGMPWLILSASGVICFVVLGAALDLKFFFLALLWIFLVIPLMMAFLYFFYGMKPLTAFNAIDHKLIFSDTSVSIIIVSPVKEETGGEEDTEKELPGNEVKGEKEIENDEETAKKEHHVFEVKKEDFYEIKSDADSVIAFSRKDGWLWLPLAAFESLKTFQNVIENLMKK